MADKDIAQTFAQHIDDVMSNGFLTLGLSLGSKLGLFDLMAGLDQPKTSQQIADAAGYKERYVREWLNFMVVGQIVQKDENGYYFLPHHHRHVLAGQHKGNKVVRCWALPIVSHVEQNLMDVFKMDGPRATTANYPGIHDWRQRMLVDSMDSRIGELLKAPGIEQQLEAGIEVAELGCGSGQMVLEMGKRFPKSKFYGFDIADEALETAKKSVIKEEIFNVKFENQDVCSMPVDWSKRFDWIYCKFVVHDLPFASKCLQECFRCLKQGGKLSVIEVNVHSDPNLNIGSSWASFVSMMSLYHCLSFAMCEEGSDGLGATWGKEKVLETLKKTGFSQVDNIDENETYIHFFCTK